MGFGGRVRIDARGRETGVRRDVARRGRGGTTRARAHDARVVARRRARRAPHLNPKKSERASTHGKALHLLDDVVGGGGHGDDTGAAGRLDGEGGGLERLDGGAVRNLRSERGMGGQRRVGSGISPPLPRAEKVPMPASRGAASGRETRGEDTNLGGGLGGDGGLHAEGRGHGGHGRHDNVRVCVGVSPTGMARRGRRVHLKSVAYPFRGVRFAVGRELPVF